MGRVLGPPAFSIGIKTKIISFSIWKLIITMLYLIYLMGNSARNKHKKSLCFVSRGNGGTHADFTKTTFTEIKPTQAAGKTTPPETGGIMENGGVK